MIVSLNETTPAKGRLEMMRRTGRLARVALAAAVLLGGLADATPAGATATSAATTGAATTGYRYSHVVVRRAGTPCRNVFVDSIDESGDAALGTVYCGSPRAFVRSGRRINLLSLPRRPRQNTEGGGLADDGTAVLLSYAARAGRYASYLRAGRYASYLRAPSGRVTPFTHPNAGAGGTVATDVNEHGEIVGYFYVGGSNGRTQGFVSNGNRVRGVPLRGCHAQSVQVLAVNNHGDLAGTYRTRNGRWHGFVIVRGHLHVVDAPGAGSRPGDGTQVTSIDDGRDYAGVVFFGGPGNDDNPFVAHSESFVHHRGRFHRITVPRAWGSNTMVTAISDTGGVVGSYVALTRRGWEWQGFTATR